MRVIGGKWRGRELMTPKGDNTRPTTDRVRESLASMILAHFDLDISTLQVLDAFAGSGALGIEMLSRGVRRCLFCERDKKTAALIKRNLEALGCAYEQAQVLSCDTFSLPSKVTLFATPFDLVFFDPPYAYPVQDIAQLVYKLRRKDFLAPQTLVVYEHSSQSESLETCGFALIKERTFGTTTIELVEMDV